MKSALLITAAAIVCAFASAHSQAPAPGAAANPQKLLETIRETNTKLLEQQAKTIQLLDEMEKTSQTIKTLGKRA